MQDITRGVLCFSLFILVGGDAVAQLAQRTFVSAGSGSDSNLCTRQSPCRNFAAAIAQTSAGGEVIVLDSGGYGALTITSSISLISPPGVYAGVTGFSGNAVSVAIGATDEVVLRGLTFQGLGSNFGISYTAGGMLSVEGCVVNNFFTEGIHCQHAADGGRMTVVNSVVRNCGLNGIVVWTTVGFVHALLDNVRAENNGPGAADGYGVWATIGSRVMVSRSVLTSNSRQLVATLGTMVDVEQSQLFGIRGGSFGVDARDAGTIVRVSNSVITNNNIGVIQTLGASISSRGNNTLEGNIAGNAFLAGFGPK